jgi:hypothetical protein
LYRVRFSTATTSGASHARRAFSAFSSCSAPTFGDARLRARTLALRAAAIRRRWLSLMFVGVGLMLIYDSLLLFPWPGRRRPRPGGYGLGRRAAGRWGRGRRGALYPGWYFGLPSRLVCPHNASERRYSALIPLAASWASPFTFRPSRAPVRADRRAWVGQSSGSESPGRHPELVQAARGEFRGADAAAPFCLFDFFEGHPPRAVKGDLAGSTSVPSADDTGRPNAASARGVGPGVKGRTRALFGRAR